MGRARDAGAAGSAALNRVVSTAETTIKLPVRWAVGHLLPRTAMLVAARRGDLQGQLLFVGNGGDPAPILARIRAHGPLYEGRFGYLTASHEVVRDVLGSNDFRAGFDVSELAGVLGRGYAWASVKNRVGPLEAPSLLVTEPPDHTRYRKLVTRVFSVRAVAQLRQRTEQIAAALLDELAGRDDVDIVESYCTLLPVTVIAEILGVPIAERDKILALGEGAAPSLDLGLTWRQFRSVESALDEFDAWLNTHIDALRATPGDNLLSQLIAATDEGVGLTHAELVSIAGLVLAAGFETTVNLLSNGINLLCEHPEQLDALRADPAGWPNAVDEILRVDPPVLLTGRTATRDTTVAGTHVGRGQRVTTMLAAANRDPEVFADPDVFDVSRPNAKDHVSFSGGRHFCLGAALARMEGEVGLRTLFDRYPDLELRDGATRRETRILRGFARLPTRLNAPTTVTVS